MSHLDWFRSSLVLALTAGSGCSADDTKAKNHTDTGPHSAARWSCSPATPILDNNGVASGLVECPDGSIDRASVEVCDPAPPAAPACSVSGNGTCDSDSDCGPRGFCLDGYAPSEDTGSVYGSGCGCVHTCSTDAECGVGQACLCGGAVTRVSNGDYSHCVSASCASDADCPSGECGLAVTTFGGGCPYDDELACRTAADTCREGSECTGGDCAVEGGQWQCNSTTVSCGRPLEVAGALRLAPPADRPEWQTGHVGDLHADQALAAWWSTIGAMEHASVASFNRVALELMVLGAPPELVAGCQRAALDEIAHATACWGLARAHGATDAGPGPMDLSGLVIRTDRREILAALISEACVGETLSAAEVRAGASAARSPTLRDALSRIATDEEEHAALAWRTLGWLLRDADAETVAFARTVFESELARALAAPPPALHAPDHGVLGGTDVIVLRKAVADRVLRPAFSRVA